MQEGGRGLFLRFHVQKCPQEIISAGRQEALRMKLHAIHRECLVADRHDLARAIGGDRPRIDLEVSRQRRWVDDETVIASGFNRRSQVCKEAFAGVLNGIDLTVHQSFRSHNSAAKDLSDRLMAQADAQNRHPASKSPHHIAGDASFVGRAWTGRDHQMAGRFCCDLIASDLVVAVNLDRYLGRNLPQTLDEVPGE